MPTWCNRWFLLKILLLAQHVSCAIMPIIRSSRVLHRWLLPVVFSVLVIKLLSVWCVFANRTHNPQLHTIPTTWKPKHQIPQAAFTCIILSSSWWWAQWCTKHVEQAIRSAIKTICCVLLAFYFHILSEYNILWWNPFDISHQTNTETNFTKCSKLKWTKWCPAIVFGTWYVELTRAGSKHNVTSVCAPGAEGEGTACNVSTVRVTSHIGLQRWWASQMEIRAYWKHLSICLKRGTTLHEITPSYQLKWHNFVCNFTQYS